MFGTEEVIKFWRNLSGKLTIFCFAFLYGVICLPLFIYLFFFWTSTLNRFAIALETSGIGDTVFSLTS